jgi:hypothetical protein
MQLRILTESKKKINLDSKSFVISNVPDPSRVAKHIEGPFIIGREFRIDYSVNEAYGSRVHIVAKGNTVEKDPTKILKIGKRVKEFSPIRLNYWSWKE